MYELENQKVLTWALEYHVVDHCNLRCRQCASFSPHLSVRTVSLQDFIHDLERASHALKPQLLRLAGGEPLLHPQILDLIREAKNLKIAPAISVTTNGFLLPKMPDEFWRLLDRLTVSVYSSKHLGETAIKEIESKAAAFDVHLNLKHTDRFQDLTPEKAPLNDQDAQTSFDECWMKQRCHILDRGFFYKCTRPAHLSTILNRKLDDGVSLDSPKLNHAILQYLNSTSALESCRFCLGNRGDFREHAQLTEVTKGLNFS